MSKNRVSNFLLLGGLFIIIMCSAFLYMNRNCFKIGNISYSVAREFKEAKEVVFIYNLNICGSCPSGKYLYSLKDKENKIFVVTPGMTKDEIRNFRDVFNIRGKIIKGDGEAGSILRIVSACYKKKDWRNNCIMKKNKKGNLKFVRFL